MSFSGHFSEDPQDWQHEARSLSGRDQIQRSPLGHFYFRFGANSAWSLLISLLIDELVDEQRIEHLERCWMLEQPSKESKLRSSNLKQLWALMFC